jgi:hypothetical protein
MTFIPTQRPLNFSEHCLRADKHERPHITAADLLVYVTIKLLWSHIFSEKHMNKQQYEVYVSYESICPLQSTLKMASYLHLFDVI